MLWQRWNSLVTFLVAVRKRLVEQPKGEDLSGSHLVGDGMVDSVVVGAALDQKDRNRG